MYIPVPVALHMHLFICVFVVLKSHWFFCVAPYKYDEGLEGRWDVMEMRHCVM